jgi:hypothetical protein
MMYATHLFKRQMHVNTIKVYLFAVRHYHIVNNFNSPLLDTPRLQLVLKAAQRKCFKCTEKLPVTYEILENVQSLLSTTHDDRLLWAAMTLGFFGLLRAAEFTTPSQASFNPDLHLTMNDVSLRTHQDGTKFMSVRIKMSKTDKSCEGFFIHIGCSQRKVCAVCAMTSYLEGKAVIENRPLFTFTNNTILTRSTLVNSTRSYLALSGGQS